MIMNYITWKRGEKEMVMAVAGNEGDAENIIVCLGLLGGEIVPSFQVRTLYYLLENKIEIPQEMKWIVESDRKFHARLDEDRLKNLTDENALSFKPEK